MGNNISQAIKQDKKNKAYKKDKSILPMEHEVEQKLNAVEYYNNLSDADKLEFKHQLEMKKLRDNYASYVQYIFGENYLMTNFHKVLCSTCQWAIDKAMKEDKQIRILLSTPPQVGKGYPIDFPVLTTKGWKKHGDLKVGDYVYNDNGEQVAVLGNQKPYSWHCLEVTFADGTRHIVTREHLWKVYLEQESRIDGKHHNIRKPYILETQDIMKSLPKYRRSPYVLMNKPLQNEEKDLPIDPYIFGLWLGDGISKANEIVVADSDLKDELIGIGDKETYCVTKKKGNTNVSYIKLGIRNGKVTKGNRVWDFTQKLFDMGVQNNKYIPTDYLLASENQRWELLKGLMDTDGCVDKHRGACEYCGTNKRLCEDVLTLLRSLGIKASIHESDAKLYGRVISKKYRINFSADKGQKLFKIKRKQERIDNKKTKDREDKYKYFITSIKPVSDQIVSCISVEGGMYLAGKELIPTHNSMSLTETLPSWFIGNYPDMSVIITGYNADVAEKFGDRNRQKVKDYGKEIFGVEVSDSQDNKTLFQIKKHQGQIYSTGIYGSLTSNPAALCIVDDPFKNGEEVNNQSIRDSVFRVYQDSIESRLRKKGCVLIIVHTRWHEDDLIGRLAEEQGYMYLNFPAVWEKGEDKLLHRKIGETLCPELGMTAEWAERQKRISGSRVWNALYQGKPFVDGGNIINRDNIKFYNKHSLPPTFDEITLSCDLSFGGVKANNDPNCLAVWGRVGANHYLLKQINKKCGFQETIEMIKLLSAEFPTMRKKLIEKKANGNATIELLNQHISGIVPFDPMSNSKETRFKLVAPYFESGNIYLPDEKTDKDSEDIVSQLLKFPNVAHDEYVDITTQYLLDYSYKHDGGRIRTDSYYTVVSNSFRGIKI